VSMLVKPGAALHDPEADAVLLQAIEKTVQSSTNRSVERVVANIEVPSFSDTPAGVRGPSSRYQQPSRFQGVAVAADPLEQSAPVFELTGCSAADVRHALARAVRGRIPDPILDDLLLATSETVTNALLHGRPPVTVRAWATADSVVTHVHDTGPGPADPLARLIPPFIVGEDPGLGLWITHQLNIEVALIHGRAGFTVRLRAGTIVQGPTPAP
jgi:anti-sigma regulatory factor (Ser/Thr protein kinase)